MTVLQHRKSVCIKADTCVNSPGFELDVSLLMCIRTHTECRHECEWCPGRQTLAPSCWAELACSVAILLTTFPSTKFSTIVRKSQEDFLAVKPLNQHLTTPANVSGAFCAQGHVMGCTVGASHQDDCEEESNAEGPSWATSGWLQTGSHLTGLRRRGTCRSPVGEAKHFLEWHVYGFGQYFCKFLSVSFG